MSTTHSEQTPYRAHMEQLRTQLAQRLFAPAHESHESAFFDAGGKLMSQLALLEALVIERTGGWRPLWKAVQHPWVAGYCTGTAMGAIEKYGVARNSSDAASVMVTLMQTMLLGGSYEQIEGIVRSLTGDPEYVEGMRQACVDFEGSEASNQPPDSLIRWLADRLSLRTSNEPT